MPEKGIMAQHRYKDAAYPVVALMHKLYQERKLTPVQEALMAPRLPEEEFYNCLADPHEISNLAGTSDPTLRALLEEHRSALNEWRNRVGDLTQQPESPDIVEAAVQSAEESWGTAECRK